MGMEGKQQVKVRIDGCLVTRARPLSIHVFPWSSARRARQAAKLELS